ncbi:hypothetical protein SUDANB37_01832 [Streptomyces sp. enrichment culture]
MKETSKESHVGESNYQVKHTRTPARPHHPTAVPGRAVAGRPVAAPFTAVTGPVLTP